MGGGGAAGPEFSHTLVIVLKRRKTQEAKARGGDGREGGEWRWERGWGDSGEVFILSSPAAGSQECVGKME